MGMIVTPCGTTHRPPPPACGETWRPNHENRPEKCVYVQIVPDGWYLRSSSISDAIVYLPCVCTYLT